MHPFSSKRGCAWIQTAARISSHAQQMSTVPFRNRATYQLTHLQQPGIFTFHVGSVPGLLKCVCVCVYGYVYNKGMFYANCEFYNFIV